MSVLISVVVPVYNAEKFLERMIQSVENQTLNDWELLLIDDCSVDESWKIMHQNEGKKIRCFRCEENKGPAHARNIGIKMAEGRYLAFLDADDFWKADKLEKQVAFMQQNSYAFTFTGYEFADENGRPKDIPVHAPAKVEYSDILKSSTIAPSTTMFDRQYISDDLLKMPEGIAREDAATWLKILKNGFCAYGLDEVLTVYCRHRGAYSGNKLRAVLGKWQIYHEVEGFAAPKAAYYVLVNTWAAVKRRMKKNRRQ